MRRLMAFPIAFGLAASPLAAQLPRGRVAVPAPQPAMDFTAASLAWDHGDYISAIDQFTQLLALPSGVPWQDSVALITGELYQTRELTTDGTRPVFSPDSRFAAWEGRPPLRTTTIVRVADGSKVAEVPGTGLSFSASGTVVAYSTLNSSNVATIALRDVTSGVPVPITGLADWVPTSVTFGAGDTDLFVVAARSTDSTKNEILRARREGNAFVVQGTVPSGLGYKGIVLAVPGGRFLVHTVTQGNPVRLTAGMAGLRSATAFGVIDLTAGTSRRILGSGASFSADGSTLVYLSGNAMERQIVVEPMAGGASVVVKRSPLALVTPALSPNGQTVVFGMTPVYDAELYLINSDGSNERRLTREIQHDVLPVFLGNDRVLAVMGEPRHRRSYLYDVPTLTRARLFHNNTVRTIAPEYDWIPSADGTKVLITAERDGNTVSPDRGIYLTDLNLKVSQADLMARLAAMKASETTLRTRGIAAFRPIAGSVRALTEQVDVSRIYRYEKTLFDFDSKHISQPGNAKAIAYLKSQYASFGFTPEEQAFSPRGALGGTSANILAVLKGTENPDLVYVVSSHFDSRAEGPGADDNTSGTAALLEAARVLAKHPLPATVIFASFTGEEAGLLGSREFVRQAVENKLNIVGALNNDMLGWANDQRLDNTIRYSNPGIRDIQHAAASQFSSMITYDALYYKSTDAQAYYDAYGDIVGGIGSYPVLGNPHYHMPHDVLEVENHQLIAEASKTTVATLMLLASSPSRLKDLKIESRTGRQVQLTWTPSPEKGVTQYIVVALEPDGTERRLASSTLPRVSVPVVAAGTLLGVKAINAKGLAGWDWARILVE